MLRLCNVNRCGLYNYSCLSSGEACFSFMCAQLSMGCSRGGRSPGKTAATWAAVPERSPGNRHPPEEGLLWGEGLLWAAKQPLLAFLVCKHRLNLHSPVKGVFFCPLMRKIPSAGKQRGWDSSWRALAGCAAPAKCCLRGSCSPGISRIHPSSLPALKCPCKIVTTAENLQYCAF